MSNANTNDDPSATYREYELNIGYLFCADWGKAVEKRSCCIVDMEQRRIQFLDEPELTFEKLLKVGLSYAKKSRVLMSLDLAIGVPSQVLESACQIPTVASFNFLEWLRTKDPDSKFWNETKLASEWSQKRPFISVPAGKGSLRKFYQVAGHDLKRLSDKKYGGKSPFIVSGIPGTVGSGTRSFWRELHPHLQDEKEFGVWPFDGDLCSLFQTWPLAVAENYPAISYTSVFSEKLPGPQLLLSKTHKVARAAAINQLSELSWLKEAELSLPDLNSCIASEDDFDSFMAALSQFRLLNSKFGIVDENSSDPISEGGILGSNAIKDVKKRSLDAILGVTLQPRKKRNKRTPGTPLKCPLCDHVFKQARNGWRDHISSMNRHPKWHPEVTDKKARQSLFEKEYPAFFEAP